MNQPTGLRALMYEKYGEEKFAIGCMIVALFVGFKSSTPWDADKVQTMCNEGMYTVDFDTGDISRFELLFGKEKIRNLLK